MADASETKAVMLHVADLHAFYGKSHVLHGVTFDVAAGEIVALLGRNGSGRSTTAKALMGLVDARGTIDWRGRPIAGLRACEIARAGLGYVPETRDVFPRLTVHENLVLGVKPGRFGGRAPASAGSFEDAYEMFPRLRERRDVEAGVLSGGEQQMLALARSLMGDPGLLIVDEPTEGLAPQVVEQVALGLTALATRGIAVLLIEQRLAIALRIAHRCLVMGRGRIVFEGPPEALRADTGVRREWLEV
jgi:branched-chain amino acid transport system ATP-binding protein